MQIEQVPFLGVGIGFREALKEQIFSYASHIDFLELMTDHYIDMPPHKHQEVIELSEKFPLVLHGVELSIGSDCSVDQDYLQKMHQVAQWSHAKWISDHLCFTRLPTLNIGQLTPLSFNKKIADLVVSKTREVVSTFQCPFLLENISYYFLVPPFEMTEAEFINKVIRESGCWMLLDLTNVQNNAVNNDYDSFDFLDKMPLDRVVQIHLAGGYYHREILLDTHSHPVPQEVLEMLEYIAPRLSNLKGVLIERDQEFPPFEDLVEEMEKVRKLLKTKWFPLHYNQQDSALQRLAMVSDDY